MRKPSSFSLAGMLCKLAVLSVPLMSGHALGYDERGCLDTDVVFETGHGCWMYHDTGANIDKPVRVWYYYPPNFAQGSRAVVFAMHGSGRNAEGAIERWLPYADDYGALIIAPEFSEEYYPSSRNYNQGNVRDGNGAVQQPADWTFSTIEEIFDHVRAAIPEAPSRYSIQGHSAGGQFVHRMVLLAPNSRIDTAVAANPGWYLLPDEDSRYPCGIADFSQQGIDLAAAYAKNLVVTLGTEDNDPNAPDLNHGSCAELQGTNRYDRGRFFFASTHEDASSLGLPFNWRLVEVPGVGHDADGMVEAGANAILGTSDVQPAWVLEPAQDATVKASYPTSNYGSRETLQVDGNSVKTTYLEFDLRSATEVASAVLRIHVTDPSSGVMSVHEAAHNRWTETRLTYSNQPGIAGRITTIDGAGTGWLSIDLTDYVRDRLGRVVTLVLRTSDSNGLYFESRESAAPPRLELYR